MKILTSILLSLIFLNQPFAFCNEDLNSASSQVSSPDQVAVLTEFVQTFRKNKEVRSLLRRSIRSKNELQRTQLKEAVLNYFNDRDVQVTYSAGTYVSWSLIAYSEWGGDRSDMQRKNNWFNDHRTDGTEASFGPGIGSSVGYMVEVCIGNSALKRHDRYGLRTNLVIGVGMSAILTANAGGACVAMSAALGLEAHVGFTEIL